jgi:Stress responsive A/B Barrel Domain
VLRHVVLFRWNEGTEPAHVDRVEAELRAMLDRLDMVRAWSLGRDAGLREGNADMALVVDMDDADAFRRYSADAGHRQILNELILPACTRTGVQFFARGNPGFPREPPP